MKTTLLLAALALASGSVLQPAFAAHAGSPYKNVDRRNDAGNDTGDSQVDQLNAAQLNQGVAPAPAQPMTPAGMAPRRGAPVSGAK